MDSSVGTMGSGHPVYEAEKHAEAIILPNRASNPTSLKNPVSKESKEEVRDRTDDIVEKRKLGMKEQLSLAETTRKRALAATANFLAIDRGDIVCCAKELTRHMATPTTADWEKVVRLGRCCKNRPRDAPFASLFELEKISGCDCLVHPLGSSLGPDRECLLSKPNSTFYEAWDSLGLRLAVVK